MVVNLRYRFVFVHIPKSAGVSIMHALGRLDGNVRWPASTRHETLREFRRRVEAADTPWSDDGAPAAAEFFSFAFLRNPWDRLASFYRYLVEKRPREEIDTVASFSDFLRQARDGVAWVNGLYAMKSQLRYVEGGPGEPDADFVGHYEYLAQDLASVGRQLGIDVTLPHMNASSNSSRDYRAAYDDESDAFIRERFAEDIERFGYGFDDVIPVRRCSGPLRGARAVAGPDRLLDSDA